MATFGEFYRGPFGRNLEGPEHGGKATPGHNMLRAEFANSIHCYSCPYLCRYRVQAKSCFSRLFLPLVSLDLRQAMASFLTASD